MHAYGRTEILMQWIEHLVDGREDLCDNMNERLAMIVEQHIRILRWVTFRESSLFLAFNRYISIQHFNLFSITFKHLTKSYFSCKILFKILLRDNISVIFQLYIANGSSITWNICCGNCTMYSKHVSPWI